MGSAIESELGGRGAFEMTDIDCDPHEDRMNGDLARDLLLHDKWRQLFDKYDPEGFGEIPWDDFLVALETTDFQSEVESNKRLMLAEKAQERKTTAITFQDFVNIMSGKRSRSFKMAVHQRDREVWSEHDFQLITEHPPVVQRMIRGIADEFLTDDRDRKFFSDHYRCCPPPFFILLVIMAELSVFAYYTVNTGSVDLSGPIPKQSFLIYRPDKKSELWRFVFYMVLHAGWVHLVFNVFVQMLVGLPLEMIHGPLKIGTVYMAGVLAGSMGTSVIDTEVYIVGSSGGVYALLVAHLANILLNYSQMELGILRLLFILVMMSADVGFAIYNRYAVELGQPPLSFIAHLAGVLTGLSVGLLVLKNYEQRLHEQLTWWVVVGIYCACVIFAILFNVFHPSNVYDNG